MNRVSEKSKHSAIGALRLFNEKADKLESLSFTKTIVSEPLSFHFKYDSRKGGGAGRTGPQGESIDAFVLTFRQFFQNNDPVSFQNMPRHYDVLRAADLIPQNLARDLGKKRDYLNRFLDSETYMNYNGRQLTRRYILDVFFYGALAHTNKEKRAVYDQWQAVPPFFPMVEREFIAIMRDVLAVIFGVRDLNKRALKEIAARPT
jgi:hypothetical protein